MSGRVVALAVNPKVSRILCGLCIRRCVAHHNRWNKFDPISENAPTQHIGEIAMHWPSRTLWVGTGESNASRSSYAGMGMLKTTDRLHGKLQSAIVPYWKNINRPSRSQSRDCWGNRIFVFPQCCTREFITTMVEKWPQASINEETGIIDMAYAPNNFNIQFAAAWKKTVKHGILKGMENTLGFIKVPTRGKLGN